MKNVLLSKIIQYYRKRYKSIINKEEPKHKITQNQSQRRLKVY